MAYNKYISDSHEKITKLLDEIEKIEAEAAEMERENLRLKSMLRQTEETTTRACLGGDISKGLDTDTPPEKRPEIKASKRRIKAATDLFERNFDIEGNPTTDFGDKLRKRYGGIGR